MTLGLPDGDVSLLPYSTAWARAGAIECGRLQTALAPWAKQVEHVGSTAVPDLAAKPVIDICVGVSRLGDADEMVGVMASLGYDYPGDVGIPGDRVFGREPSWRTHLVHVVVYQSDQWSAYIRFRDALRCNEELRSQYEALKQELAERHRGDRFTYTQRKTTFVQGALENYPNLEFE